MARCGDCNKFVSYSEEPQVDFDSPLEVVDVDATPTTGDQITFAVTTYLESSIEAMLLCSECSTELAQASIEANGEVEHTCTADAPEKPETDDFTLDTDDVNGYLDSQPKMGKRGQPLKEIEQYVGVEVTGTLSCGRCGGEEQFVIKTNEITSAFEAY